MDTHLIPHDENTNVSPFQPQSPVEMDLDTCIAAWLHAKQGRSGSQKTAIAYKDTLMDFRQLLRTAQHDLDAPAAVVAPLAQGWASQARRVQRVTANTYNQRLAILSSFYKYAVRHEVLGSNPVERVERRVIIKEHQAHAIDASLVGPRLKSVNRKTDEGKRDHALLQVALATGRRVGELAGMRFGHLTFQGISVVVRFPRCKGGKQMTDTLPEKTTAALSEYLHAAYGSDLAQMPPDTPVWISFSDRCRGKAIGTRTLQRICERYLGTPKFHTTRHTWAVTMSKKNATLQEIGKGLGHSNLKTTSDYLEEHLSYENRHAAALEEAFGFGEDE